MLSNFEIEKTKIEKISDLVMKIFNKDERGHYRGLGVANRNRIFYIFPILSIFSPPRNLVKALQMTFNPNSISDNELYNPLITLDLNDNKVYDYSRRFSKECRSFISEYEKEFGTLLELESE